MALKDLENNDKISVIGNAISTVLSALGEDTQREGLTDTPTRVAKALIELTEGQFMTLGDVVKDAVFNCESQGMILQEGIEFFSLCEHHLLPFYGHVHVAYIPDKKIIGLSKIGRIIDIFSKRLQVQEHLTHQIAKAIDTILKPKGVAVFVEANHFCMMMRGVKKQGCVTITSEYFGQFADDHQLRSDFLQSIHKKNGR